MTARKKATEPVAETPAEPINPSRIKRKNHGKNHSYWLDGEVKLDGVTTLIGNGLRKKALENWSGNVTAEYAVDHWDELTELTPSARLSTLKKARFESRDKAANRGTAVHALAEQIIAGHEVDVPDELRGHVESAVRFLDDWKIRPIATETTVFHISGGYAGTLDMVVTSDLLPGRVILADWKTSRSGIYGETALQLAAYGNADFYLGDDGEDHPVADLGITDHWGVWTRGDGYTVYPLDRSPETFRTFQYVATVARRTEGDSRPLDALKGEALFLPGGAS